jgi:hypothetical protein
MKTRSRQIIGHVPKLATKTSRRTAPDRSRHANIIAVIAAIAAWLAVCATIAVPAIQRSYQRSDEKAAQLDQLKVQISRAMEDISVSQALVRVLDPRNPNLIRDISWVEFMRRRVELQRRQEDLAFNRLPVNGDVSNIYAGRDQLHESMLGLLQIGMNPRRMPDTAKQWDRAAGTARLSMSMLARTVNIAEAANHLRLSYDPDKPPMASAEYELSYQTMQQQKALDRREGGSHQ